MSQREVAIPFIHLNGDRAETLINNLYEVYNSLSDAEEKLRQCAPNGRNAYPVAGLMEKLTEQHTYRLGLLRDLLESIQAEAEGIQNAI